MNVGGLLLGYGLGYSNQVSTFFNVHFDWESAADQSKYEGMIGGAVVLGMTLGAVSAGSMMKLGRRKALIGSSFVGVLGICITMVLQFYCILAGRVLFGFSCGVISALIPRFIEETVPNHLYD
mmetsp:Transcript_4389/g.7430  ORF Transcript_4389/g.7430 Transcript_4389/m.7430 type:complete len:123 (+) Transcript_4389:213-581(+)